MNRNNNMEASVNYDEMIIVCPEPSIHAQRIQYLKLDERTRHLANYIIDEDLRKSGQLAYMGSKPFEITDSELFGRDRKKDQR